MRGSWATAVLALGAWEGFWWLRRRDRRARLFDEAHRMARTLGRPLVVVGAPDRGSTGGYPCGDVTIDAGPSSCPGALQADVTRPLPFADDSAVVFVSCVLEYVDDVDAARRELLRVSGGWLWNVGVEPWTLTAWLYPGTKRRLAPGWATETRAYARIFLDRAGRPVLPSRSQALRAP